MVLACAVVLFLFAGLGLALLAVQYLALRVHLRRPPAATLKTPGISVLKPLCGVDDELWANLAVFSQLDYPRYEVLLGVKDRTDPAYAVACQAQARWPQLMRVVIQRGEPGLNPKVNQLITLARVARYDILAVSDSNVRVARNYLTEIAGHLEDPQVGLVTHPLVGIGARRMGSRLDNLHLTSAIGPGVIAAKRVGGKDFVVAKSMALRRCEVEALGGFRALKDVLAEDYVTGKWVVEKRQQKVALAATPIHNVCCSRSVRDFIRRYARWSVMQRRAVGPVVYSAMLILNPVLLSSLAVALARTQHAWIAWGSCCAVKTAIDGLATNALLGSSWEWRSLLIVPIKDLLVAAAWFCGLLSNRVNWRGNHLLVLKGTKLVPANRPQETAYSALNQTSSL